MNKQGAINQEAADAIIVKAEKNIAQQAVKTAAGRAAWLKMSVTEKKKVIATRKKERAEVLLART